MVARWLRRVLVDYSSGYPASGMLPVSTGGGNYSWQAQSSLLGGGSSLYGDGNDGTAAFDGTNTFGFASKVGSVYTLTRDVFLTTMTVSSGVTVGSGSYRIYCQTSLTVNSTGVLHNDGGAASGTTAGASPGPGTIGLASINGGAGVAPPGAGGHTGNNGATQNLLFGGAGGSGGTGGFSGTAPAPGSGGAAGGATYVASMGQFHQQFTASQGHLIGAGAIRVFGGGAGGGSGSTSASDGAGSGAGGGGGGLLLICAPAVTNNGRISANGGVGGNGQIIVSTGGVGGGGGGGGGGVFLVRRTRSGSAPVASGGVGGNGVNGGGGVGYEGTAGATGGAGFVFEVAD